MNYDLVKLLHNALDDAWRIEKHYQADAKKHGCKSCQALLAKMAKEMDANIVALEKELAAHMGKKARLE